jgi:hypothetical protein
LRNNVKNVEKAAILLQEFKVPIGLLMTISLILNEEKSSALDVKMQLQKLVMIQTKLKPPMKCITIFTVVVCTQRN